MKRCQKEEVEEKKTMVTQYFTFGCGQAFPNTYIEIKAVDDERCRQLMFEKFGPKWSMQYDEDSSLVKHGMRKLATIEEGEQATRIQTFELVIID